MTDTQKKLTEWAAQRCSVREYASTDMYQKLINKGASPKMSTQIIEFLQKRNFINDERFALAYASDKMKYNQWGKKKIALKLRLLGVENDYIKKAIEELDATTYQNMLTHLLEQKAKTIHADNSFQRAQKLMRFAAGRGFDAEEIYETIRNLEK